MAEEIQAQADREIAGQKAKADTAVGELLDLGERPDAVAELLGLTVAEVRAARRRARAGVGDAAGAPDAAAEEDAGAGGGGEPDGAAETTRGGAGPVEKVAA